MDPTVLRDQELLSRVAAGDRAAFTDFFDRHAAAVLGVLTQLVGRREVGEELLQETFLQAWGEVHRYRGERATPRGWLLMMARSRAIDRLRSSGARARREETVGRELVGAGRTEAMGTTRLEAEERRRTVREALDRLPPEQRESIELAFYEGLSHRQVAERLGQPLGTVKSRILLGMGKLRQALST